MKVKVEFTVDISPEERLGLGTRFGHADKPATSEEIKQFFAEQGLDRGKEIVAVAVREHYAHMAQKYRQMAAGEQQPLPVEGPDETDTVEKQPVLAGEPGDDVPEWLKQ